MSQITNSAFCQLPHSFALRTTITWTVMMCLVALLMLTGATVSLAELTPTESVKSTITEVIRILSNGDLKQPGRAAERRQEIEKVVRLRVSYEEMAKRALGNPWLELTAPERQEFVDLFVQLLRDTFACRIDDYADEQVLYLSEQRDEHFAEVRTKLSGHKMDTLLDLRLVNRFGDWVVYDAVVDGASIVSNYRSQFTSIVRDLSYAGLVKRMKEKTLVVKAFETTTTP